MMKLCSYNMITQHLYSYCILTFEGKVYFYLFTFNKKTIVSVYVCVCVCVEGGKGENKQLHALWICFPGYIIIIS